MRVVGSLATVTSEAEDRFAVVKLRFRLPSDSYFWPFVRKYPGAIVSIIAFQGLSGNRVLANCDINAVARRAGLTRIGHHDMRGSFARISIRRGANPARIQKVLGHVSIDVALHYAGIDEDEMREALETFGSAFAGGGREVNRYGSEPVPRS